MPVAHQAPGYDRPRCALVADDDPDARTLTAAVLMAQGYEVLLAADGDHAIALAIQHRPDVALVDVEMPRRDGLAVARALRDAALAVDIVLVSGCVHSHEVEAGYEAGAHAYLRKPFGRRELLEVVDQQARLRALAAMADTDELTGLPNRRAFKRGLDAALASSAATSRWLALLDIDNFKRVNDTHGHDAGDDALVRVAAHLASCARAGDTVARLGGDEFAWLFPASDQAAAGMAVERLRDTVRAGECGPAGRLTVSTGVTSLVEGEDPAAAFRRADQRLLEAKAAGRDLMIIGRARGAATTPETVSDHREA